MISFGKQTTEKIIKESVNIKKPLNIIMRSKHPENFLVRLHEDRDNKHKTDYNVNVLSSDFQSSVHIFKSVNGENTEMIDVRRNGDVEVINLKEPLGSPFRSKKENQSYETLRIIATAIEETRKSKGCSW